MEILKDHMAAWKDFWENKKNLEGWTSRSREERAQAYVANQAYNNDHLGPVRVKRMLELYAPDRYEIGIVFKIKEVKP
jgi:hypothetical protein